MVGDAEELEGAALDGRGRGDQGEPWQAEISQFLDRVWAGGEPRVLLGAS
jgi:hypothetical protein